MLSVACSHIGSTRHGSSVLQAPRPAPAGCAVLAKAGGLGGLSACFAAPAATLLVALQRKRQRRPVDRLAVELAALPAESNAVSSVDELQEMDLAGIQTSAGSMNFGVWPPKHARRSDSQALSDDGINLTKQQMEGFRGQGKGDVPPFESWPFFEVSLDGVEALSEGDDAMKAYRVVDWSGEEQKAFAFASRWLSVSRGRSLGFTQEGAPLLSSFKATLPIFMRQLQGQAVYRRWCSENAGKDADFDKFIDEYDADEATSRELAAFALGLPEAAEGRTLYAQAIIGSTKGSALAVWAWEPALQTARVEFCLGHDCLEFGPDAEECLIRLICGKAKNLGASMLMCRSRFTEDGKLVKPLCSDALGMSAQAGKDGEPEFEEAVDAPQSLEAMEVEDIPESVPGLRVWLAVRYLDQHIKAVNEWCEEMGAATVNEVEESAEDLAEALGSLLSEGELKRLLKR